LGSSRNDLGSSEYLRTVQQIEYSNCPYFDIEEEWKLQDLVKEIIRLKMAQSVHDVSDGGLLANVLESSIPRNLGFEIKSNPHVRKDAWLFGESQSRVVVSIEKSKMADFEQFLQVKQMPFEHIGQVTGQDVVVDGAPWGAVSAWKKTYNTVLSDIMG
jgi:phosphoribosylformylglycinamidine synthase